MRKPSGSSSGSGSGNRQTTQFTKLHMIKFWVLGLVSTKGWATKGKKKKTKMYEGKSWLSEHLKILFYLKMETVRPQGTFITFSFLFSLRFFFLLSFLYFFSCCPHSSDKLSKLKHFSNSKEHLNMDSTNGNGSDAKQTQIKSLSLVITTTVRQKFI